MNPVKMIDIIDEISIYAVLLATAIDMYLFFAPYINNKKLKLISAGVVGIVSIVAYAFWDGFRAGVVYAICMGFTFCVLALYEPQKMLQRAYLCICFYMMRILTAGIMTEISFWSRDLPIIKKIDTVDAMVREFLINRILYVMLFFGLLHVSGRFFHNVYKEKTENLTWSEFIFLSLPQITILLVMKIVVKYFYLFGEGIANGSIQKNIPADGYRVLFYITAYGMQIMLMAAYQRTKEEQAEHRQNELIEQQMHQMKKHIAQIELLYQDTYRLRHDFGNHIQVMEQLIRQGEKQAATDYLARIKEEQAGITPHVKTGNPVTDVIIREKMREAENRNISFTSDYCYPCDRDMDAFDISIILNNIIDNGLDFANGKAPFIRVKSEQVAAIYIISVTNSYTGKLSMDADTAMPITKKGAGHGIGLQNVRRVVKKYGGDLVIEQEEGEVITSVLIPSHP